MNKNKNPYAPADGTELSLWNIVQLLLKKFYWLLLAEPDTVSTATSAIPIIRGLSGANDGDAA